MLNQFSRTELLFGSEKMNILKNSRVAVFGIGGVGGHCTLALARSGIGALDLIDNDTVSITNINRQAVANLKTVGCQKTEVMKDMIANINPDAKVTIHNTFFLPENADEFDFSKYDYIIDAIDTVSGKIALVEKANRQNTPIISSMGAGNKLDPTAFKVADIYKTSVCPLAKVMRKELKARGIKSLKVVYSEEKALTPLPSDEISGKRQTPGSVSFVPSVVGLIIAGEVVKDIVSQ
ncbi:MAG: ThiF family adenylyltransferase [Acutalibacteraceae bacterium]